MRDRDDELESVEDRRLSALLRATHAPANPAVWQRVRAELSAAAGARPVRGRGFDSVLAWFTRPVALGAATAALVVSLGAGYGMLDSLTATSLDTGAVAYDSATLMETLLDDTSTDATETGGATDDGAIDAPTDSGGQS
jgi:hypothetical protein